MRGTALAVGAGLANAVRRIPGRVGPGAGHACEGRRGPGTSVEAGEAESQAARDRIDCLEERARRLIEMSGDAFVAVDAAGVVVEWNPQAERTFAWARQDIVGRDAADAIVPPALRPAHREGLLRAATTGNGALSGRRFEVAAVDRHGRVFPAEVVVWATPDDEASAFNAFIRDLRDRRWREEATQRLAAIVESSQDAIVSTDLEGVIQTWNHGAELIYGYPAAEAIGQPMSLIVPPDRLDEAARLLGEASSGKAVPHHETVRRTKGGVMIHVALSLSPVTDGSGTVVAASSIARDISEQRWLAATLDDTLSSLESALAHARQAEATYRRFMADAAHQLRTPLTGIRAAAEALLRDLPSPRREQLLAALASEAARAARLVGGLLQVTRLDQGATLTRTPVDVVSLCREEARRARGLSPELHVEVLVARPLELRPELDADAVREILANLLDNARRHARRRIEVVVATEADAVVVTVADDGPGLGEEEVERAFERFASLDGMGGSGLGLPIARGFAQAHGGDLTYENRRFTLRLPVRVGVVAPARATSGHRRDDPAV